MLSHGRDLLLEWDTVDQNVLVAHWNDIYRNAKMVSKEFLQKHGVLINFSNNRYIMTWKLRQIFIYSTKGMPVAG